MKVYVFNCKHLKITQEIDNIPGAKALYVQLREKMVVNLCSYSIQHGQELCVGLQASVVLLFLLLLGGQSVAVAPGDEDGECPVPQYPVHVKVLMDSWRYHTLIAGDRRVWNATEEGHRTTVSSYNNDALTLIIH